MTLSKDRIQEILSPNIFKISSCFVTQECLKRLATQHGITSVEDMRTLVDALIRVTGARKCQIRYVHEQWQIKGLVGIAIHPDYSAIPRHLIGKRWEPWTDEGEQSRRLNLVLRGGELRWE